MLQIDRVRKLIETAENWYAEVEGSLDDDQKRHFLPRINEHRAYLAQQKEKLQAAEKKHADGVAEVVRIHSDILNRYFS